MKVRVAVKRICSECKVIKRHGVIRVICESLHDHGSGLGEAPLIQQEFDPPHDCFHSVCPFRGGVALRLAYFRLR